MSQENTTSIAYKNLDDLGNRLMSQVKSMYKADQVAQKLYKAHIYNKDTQNENKSKSVNRNRKVK